jgi:hypothetical protein
MMSVPHPSLKLKAINNGRTLYARPVVLGRRERRSGGGADDVGRREKDHMTK